MKTFIAFFDIDMTILDNNGKIIESVYAIYKNCLENNVKISIITAREGTEQNISYTINQLSNSRIFYDVLYLRPSYMTDMFEFKAFCRKNTLELFPECIPIFSIGDNLWDVCNRDVCDSGIPLLVTF